MKQTRKQKRAENRRRAKNLRRRYLTNDVVTYDDLVRMHDRNPRRRKKRRNPKHDGSPTRGELKAARKAARTGDRHTYGERGGKRSAKSAGYQRVTSSSISDKSAKLIEVLGLLHYWESMDSDFWDNLPDDPNGKRVIKAMWVLAKQQGISTKAALDSFKARHVREIVASASGINDENDGEY